PAHEMAHLFSSPPSPCPPQMPLTSSPLPSGERQGEGGGGLRGGYYEWGEGNVSLKDITLIYDDKRVVVHGARSEGEDLWLSPEDLVRVSGWELTAEGVCLEGLCVPEPPGEDSFVARRGDETWANLSRLAPRLHQPGVASAQHRLW